MKKALRLFEAGLVLALSLPLAVLPLKVSLKAGEMLGLLVFSLWKGRSRIAVENLRAVISAHGIVVPDPPEHVIEDNFRNLGRSLVEVIKVYFGLGKKLIDSVVIEGEENLRAAKAKNKGLLFITGHCGNWEIMALTTGRRISGVSVVARPIDNPYLNTLVEGVRKKYGNRVIYKKGALKPILKTLKDNGVVGILMDQAVVPDEGYIMDFLGRGAWTMKMPALIARKTGAAVLPAFIHRTERGHVMRIYPEIELSKIDDVENAIKEDTRNFSKFIEEYVKAYPSEWLWIHRRWKRVPQR